MGRTVRESWEDARESRLEKGEIYSATVASSNERQVKKKNTPGNNG
jgi:hypothetical protein